MAQKDVPRAKSHEIGGPFRPGFSSQGHPSAPPICARDIRLGVIRLGHICFGHVVHRTEDPGKAKDRKNEKRKESCYGPKTTVLIRLTEVILCRSMRCRIVFCLADFMFSVYFGLKLTQVIVYCRS